MADNMADQDKDALIAQLQEQLAEAQRMNTAFGEELNSAALGVRGRDDRISQLDQQLRREIPCWKGGEAKWNNWVRHNFGDHYERIALQVHGPQSDDRQLRWLDALYGNRRVRNDILKADEDLSKAIAERRRETRREQQRNRREFFTLLAAVPR